MQHFSDDASREAVRQWYHKAKALLREPSKRHRSTVAVDAMRPRSRWKAGGTTWTAVDTESRELLGVQLTPTRDGRDASCFIRRMLKTCTNTPTVLVDGGPWYAWALSRRGVPWERVTFGERNTVEQWFSSFKHRIQRFYQQWPHNARVDRDGGIVV